MERQSVRRLLEAVRGLELPAAIAMFLVAVPLHYPEELLPFLDIKDPGSLLGLERHAVERVFLLLPITYLGFLFGLKAGLAGAGLALAIMLPRALIISEYRSDALVEVGGVVAAGAVINVGFERLRRERERRRLVAEQLRISEENLRFYLDQVTRAQEHERQRIAQELHDETAQSLLLIAQRLDRLATGADGHLPEDVASELQELRGAAVGALTDLRRLARDLRPRILDDMGLVPALEWLADDLALQYGIKARVEVEGTLPELSEETQLLLFRIAQEALRNVGRHSGAAEAIVSVDGGEDRVRMTVMDDGRGFQLPEALGDLATTGRLGLLGMYERARLLCGSLSIRSELGEGTTVTVEVPA